VGVEKYADDLRVCRRRVVERGSTGALNHGRHAQSRKETRRRRSSRVVSSPGMRSFVSGYAGSPGLDALDRAPGLDSQLHVEHDAAVGHAANGVEVSFDHLRGLPE
jgi:hypothetical protein